MINGYSLMIIMIGSINPILMKTKNYFLSILLFAFLSNFYSQGNKVNYERDTKWNFGINAGATWTENELDFVNKPGFSGGLTLGRSIYEKEGRFLSFDLRGRLLWGQTQSWSPSPFYDSTLFANAAGYGYRNYRLAYTEGSFELVVNAHRLRERTGILLYAFGGIGWVSHSITHNYKDGSVAYDYSSIDSSGSAMSIADALSSSYNDNQWETDNEFFTGRKTLVMPSLGIGLGYQITPKFSIGVEHKVTFGLNDQLDGHLDGKNDRLHYTNFNLRWNLFRGENGGGSTYVPEERPVNNPNNPGNNSNPSSNGSVGDYSTPSSEVPQVNKPLVTITTPSSDGGSIFSANYVVNAQIYYVDSKNDIVFKHNGTRITNFSFDNSSNLLNANVVLTQGANTFIVTGTNSEGSDTDSKGINYEKICDKPAISFTQPISSGTSISSPLTTIQAEILNVSNKNMIKFKHNGVINNQFTFNTSTKAFLANVTCSEGNNTFEIEATNECGNKDDSRTITYSKAVISGPPPVVTITSPLVSPYTTNISQVSIVATVLNVNNISNVEYRINGVVSNLFNYNTGTKVFNSTVSLQSGSNIIEVKGINNYGVDSKSTIIIKKVEEQLPPPVVNISYPSVSPFSVVSNSSVVNGTVFNVASKNQIQVSINGVATSNFVYNLGTKQISLTANLNSGSNTVSIKATNNRGSDVKSTVIIYKRQVVLSPPVVSFIDPTSSPISVASSSISIKARILNVNNASQIQVIKNGVSIQTFNYNLGTKELLLNTSLASGNNSFSITATNQAGSDTKSTIIVYKRQVVLLPPVVTILSPQTSPYSTSSTNTAISAKVLNVNSQSQISLTYNGVSTSNFSYNLGSKMLNFNAGLTIGTNTLVITASNNSGTDSKSQSIVRSAPCTPPTLDYQIPAQAQHVHSGRNGNMAFTFSSANINSASQITVKNNGNVIPANLEASNGNIWGTVPLVVGANTIIVSVRNDCGKANKTLQVVYKGNTSKLDPPIITIQSPSSFPHSTNNSTVIVTGKIVNVSSQNSIQVTMDGNTIPFTYNTATKALIISPNLSVGSHQIRVRATNNYGNDMEVFDLVRAGQAPSVQYTNLGRGNSYRNPFVCPQTSFTVQGRVTNLQNVTFNAYVDGNRVSNYSYNSGSGVFSIPVTFSTQGQGTQRRREVEVKVSNGVGNASKKGHLSYIVQSVAPKPSPNTSSVNQLYQNNIKKADSYFKQGKLDLAKSFYQKASSANPQSSYPKQKIGEINKKAQALKAASKVVTPKVETPKDNDKPVTKPTEDTKKIDSWSTKPITKPSTRPVIAP